MLNVDIEEKLHLIDLSIQIQTSDTPRLTAIRVLPTLKMKVLFLVNDIGAEFGALLITILWGIALVSSESLIPGVKTPPIIINEAPLSFWIMCWWLIVFIKLFAIVTGNLYMRRLGFLLGLFAWSGTLGLLLFNFQQYNILVGLAAVFAITALQNYAKASLMLQQRLDLKPPSSVVPPPPPGDETEHPDGHQ